MHISLMIPLKKNVPYDVISLIDYLCTPKHILKQPKVKPKNILWGTVFRKDHDFTANMMKRENHCFFVYSNVCTDKELTVIFDLVIFLKNYIEEDFGVGIGYVNHDNGEVEIIAKNASRKVKV